VVVDATAVAVAVAVAVYVAVAATVVDGGVVAMATSSFLFVAVICCCAVFAAVSICWRCRIVFLFIGNTMAVIDVAGVDVDIFRVRTADVACHRDKRKAVRRAVQREARLWLQRDKQEARDSLFR
jgi:hypothetical protein